MGKVTDITPTHRRSAIQVLTDVAKQDPAEVVIIYTVINKDGEAALSMQSNGMLSSDVNMMLDQAKISILLG